MQKRETDWTAQDQAMFLATKQMTDIMPPAFKRNVFHALRSPYGMTAVHAGQVDAVHDKTLEAAPEMHLEELTGPLFGLGEYRDAIAYAMSAGRLGAVKVAFDLRRLRA
ncbi:MAG: hypothetical protein E6I13_05725 [Chloroflexi bacterium]|nr:MAG: hypothetical protein E6I13_05725 [Chloroflexota bacterium]